MGNLHLGFKALGLVHARTCSNSRHLSSCSIVKPGFGSSFLASAKTFLSLISVGLAIKRVARTSLSHTPSGSECYSSVCFFLVIASLILRALAGVSFVFLRRINNLKFIILMESSHVSSAIRLSRGDEKVNIKKVDTVVLDSSYQGYNGFQDKPAPSW